MNIPLLLVLGMEVNRGSKVFRISRSHREMALAFANYGVPSLSGGKYRAHRRATTKI